MSMLFDASCEKLHNTVLTCTYRARFLSAASANQNNNSLYTAESFERKCLGAV